ncbi:hypothetical protein P22_1079 [Propionispora sp. 2/2-37]|uniref:4-hydroxy-tetrahydrodipicolinate reductase n=1 Tax=Propionispora sp. 2/2-37 TaxID=1677858 RepID=UPI0006BB7761|nr:4-hydroxy-tetrahydrodipicolinate reductase [Propionispora sp. 2/2-37]CUH95010.1 hypothetical protein P22_1079 [Propionispora sp. 2/2-37]
MKVALVGLGRTGKIVAEYLLRQQVLQMVFCRPNGPKANQDLGTFLHGKPTGIMIHTSDNLEEKLFQFRPDVLIDFSGPQFLRENIHILDKCAVSVVTAVTQYETADLEKFMRVAEKGSIGIVVAPNITYGVNILMLMTEIASVLLEGYDFEILEEHHRYKKDSPSGTAKKIADKILQNLPDIQEIPTHAVRAGSVVGKHTVMMYGEYDQLEISHQSYSREAFAQGAYKAAQFIQGKTGYYEMSDVFAYERKRKQEELFMRRALAEETYMKYPEPNSLLG